MVVCTWGVCTCVFPIVTHTVCGWVGGSFTIESRRRRHPSSRWTDPRRATCAHSSEFAFQFECQDDGAANLGGGGIGGIEMKINHVALRCQPGRGGGRTALLLRNTATIKPKRARGVGSSSAIPFELIYSHFFVAVAKTNVKTFLPSFWVMSIRLIWSAKICDLSDRNSEWAAPRHLPTSEPPCAHMLCAWHSGCSPYGESHEYLMCQIRTHALHHTFSLTHVINQSSNW